MDNRPIGVFDSGLGGLTAVKKLKEVLPGEDIVYFGDTGRVPYGGRSRETIIKYTQQDIAFLLSMDIKATSVACGTATTNALDYVKDSCPVPIYGVADPAAKRAAEITKNKKVGLIGTEASIRSGAYERLICRYDSDIEMTGVGCPLIVPMVEEGRISRDDKILYHTVEEYLTPLKEKGVDTLIMGCTHYPIISDVIGDIMGEGVALIDPGAEAAKLMKEELAALELLNDQERQALSVYYVSDVVYEFTKTASIFLGENVDDITIRIDIEHY